MTSPISPTPRAIDTNLVDGENNPVQLDAAYALRHDEVHRGAIAAIVTLHGEGTCLLPMSARSGGSGVFQISNRTGGSIVGLSVEPAPNPRITIEDSPDITALPLDAIAICPDRGEILAGAAITLDQLNRALADTVGPAYRVLGADLTSYTYAQVGATFMTGGMGPQRRYFADSVTEVALFDGKMIRSLQDAELQAHAGTYGWTGLVTAVRCRFIRVPENEIAFALPVNGNPEDLGKLLGHLGAWCFVGESGSTLLNLNDGSDLILGVEHVTLESMKPMLSSGQSNAITRRATTLAEKCREANCDGLVFINGYSADGTDEFLLSLVDDVDASRLCIAGIDLEHSEVFKDPEEMRSVREGIPYAARNQAPNAAYGFKGHTDATIRLSPDNTAREMAALWKINQRYVQALTDFFASIRHVQGQILVYGHLNPWGVDPHNRLTFASDDRAAFDSAVAFAHEQSGRFYRDLDALCHQSEATFIGGEKGAASEREILAAFDSIDEAPPSLREKQQLQSRTIARASPLFSWRALPPYAAT